MANLDQPIAVVWPEWCYENNDKDRKLQETVMNNNNNKDAKNNNVHMNNKSKDLTQNSSHTEVSSAADIPKERPRTYPAGMSTNGSGSCGDTKEGTRVSPEGGFNDASKAAASFPSSSSSSPKSVASSVLNPCYSKTSAGNNFSDSGITSLPPHGLSTSTTTSTQHPPYGGSPTALGIMGGLPGGGGTLNQGENLPTRNCSDLIRSLAAKYNTNNTSSSIGSPKDFLNTFNNGFSRSLLPSMCFFSRQSSPTSPLTSVPSPVVSAVKVSQAAKKTESSITPVSVRVPQGIPPPGAHHSIFPTNGVPGPPPGFPLVDVSSTHMLLNMVRNASVAQHSQLETYLRGKRPADGLSSPLDLSSSVATKRQKTADRKHGIQNPCLKRETDEGSSSPPISASSAKIPSPPTPEKMVTGVPCGDRECPSLERVLRWTVEDVCDFVRSVDLCAEYVEAFREHRIDGSSLPLLTEDHLTTSIHMKLGPALKLRSVLARKLGSCGVCLHCAHCHSPPTTGDRRPTSASSGQ